MRKFRLARSTDRRHLAPMIDPILLSHLLDERCIHGSVLGTVVSMLAHLIIPIQFTYFIVVEEVTGLFQANL